MEAAIDWLRKKGISKAAKKAGRVAAEGLVGVAVDGDAGALVEVNAETDFVARNDEFKEFVKRRGQSRAAGRRRSRQAAGASPYAAAPACSRRLTELVAKIGENMSVRRTVALSVNPGVVGAYVHNASSPELGKIGVLVALKSTADKDEAGRARPSSSPCMSRPPRRSRSRPSICRRKWSSANATIQAELARQSGKPENVIEKMIEGRMRKFYEETVLLSADLRHRRRNTDRQGDREGIEGSGRAGRDRRLCPLPVGEGIEKVDGDFADEVSKMAGH